MSKKYSNARKHWSNEEVEWLEENYTTKSLEKLAKHLQRSPQSIEAKIRKEFDSADKLYLDGYFSTSEIANIMGVTDVTVRERWIKNLGLEKRKYKGYKATNAKNKRCFYGINIESFYKWLKKNKDRTNINTSYIKVEYLVDCPQWLKDDIENKAVYGTGKKWVEQEVKLLMHYINVEKKSYKEVSEILGRTAISVAKKYNSVTNKSFTKTA